MTNCPNCGAPIKSWKCEYCETVFDSSKENQIMLDMVSIQAYIRNVETMDTVKRLYNDALTAMRRYTY